MSRHRLGGANQEMSMDPQIVWGSIIEALKQAEKRPLEYWEREDFEERLQDLVDWVKHGGFLPKP